jgi:uncharacterized protein (TIGR00369 family)
MISSYLITIIFPDYIDRSVYFVLGDFKLAETTDPNSTVDAVKAARAAGETVASEEILRSVISMQSFTRWTGLELIKAKNGEVETRLKLRKDDMTQHDGFLHGGLVSFLADNASAYAAATIVGDVVTSQISLNFVAPGIGEAFATHAHVVKAGKRQVSVRADVFAEQESGEKLIAMAQAVILRV